MPVELDSVCVLAANPAGLATFWAELLGQDAVAAQAGREWLLFSGRDVTSLRLRFARNDAPRTGPGRMHPELTTTSLDDQAARVERALALGATHLDVGQRVEEGHVVLADPEGNEFCVLGPGNRFLEGCGLLATFSCDGTRPLGLFFAAALGWPLVWEEGDETAVQSPHGGAKLAWGGPPIKPKDGFNRWHLDLRVSQEELDAEVARLVSLGAERREPGSAGHDPNGHVVLADPDDNELCLIPYQWSMGSRRP